MRRCHQADNTYNEDGPKIPGLTISPRYLLQNAGI